MKWCFIQPEWITKSSCNRFILSTFITRHLNFCFALKTSTGSKSKDRSSPLEDFDEAERLLERVEVELGGGHPLREGGKEHWDGGAEEEGDRPHRPPRPPVRRFFDDGHISFALGDIAKKVLLQFMSENVLLMFPSKSFSFFPSKSFMVSCLILQFWNHLGFIFMYGVRECSYFTLHVAVHFAQEHLLKRLSFLHCINIFFSPLS